jgi:hypothetical protein
MIGTDLTRIDVGDESEKEVRRRNEVRVERARF